MDRAWLINSRGLAKKVMNAGLPAEFQTKDCGAAVQCPNCQCLIDNSDVSQEWPGLPAGVKFDPSDAELLYHLAAKQGLGDSEPHVYIDEFIPTLDGGEGICYTHPEYLPGAKKDGSSVHFFYRISKAYASGRKKRRRIYDQEGAPKGNVRWHKTGKTKPVTENGVLKGFKKIMVLYAASKGGTKPDKCNWVLHQYHLGAEEHEKDGEFVVSKIFYQPQKESNKNETSVVIEVSEKMNGQLNPTTPKTNTPDLARPVKTPSSDCLSDGYFVQSLIEKDEMEYATSLAQDPEAVEFPLASLTCGEIIDPCVAFYDESKLKIPSLAQVGGNVSDVPHRDNHGNGINELVNLELDTPPDFLLDNLTFPSSQDSVFEWLDRI